jgi:hypothetical protein
MALAFPFYIQCMLLKTFAAWFFHHGCYNFWYCCQAGWFALLSYPAGMKYNAWAN